MKIGLKIMKIGLKIIALAVLSFFAISCQSRLNVSTHALSMPNMFNGDIEYAFPPLRDGYSGTFIDDHSKYDVVEGAYENGLPTGIWRYYYDNGNLKRITIYNGAGNFQDLWYYPDGQLMHFKNGRYSAKNSWVSLNCVNFLSYDESGNIIPHGKEKRNYNQAVYGSDTATFRFKDTDYLYINKFEFLDNGKFNVLAYLYKKDDPSVLVAKIKASASYDFSKNRFLDIKQSKYPENAKFKVEFSSDSSGMAYIGLREEESDELADIFYSTKPATFKFARGKM